MFNDHFGPQADVFLQDHKLRTLTKGLPWLKAGVIAGSSKYLNICIKLLSDWLTFLLSDSSLISDWLPFKFMQNINI